MRQRIYVAITLAFAFAIASAAHAKVVYTQVNTVIPVGGYYNIVLIPNGVTDFTLHSKLVQGYCQWGDEYDWTLTVTPADGNAVMIDTGHVGSDYASALLSGVVVDSSQSFYSGESVMAGLYWGACGTGTLGEWLNLPARYLGLQFQGPDGETHYGWAEVSAVAYVDQNGHLQTNTVLFGFAYETVPSQEILSGQISDGDL